MLKITTCLVIIVIGFFGPSPALPSSKCVGDLAVAKQTWSGSYLVKRRGCWTPGKKYRAGAAQLTTAGAGSSPAVERRSSNRKSGPSLSSEELFGQPVQVPTWQVAEAAAINPAPFLRWEQRAEGDHISRLDVLREQQAAAELPMILAAPVMPSRGWITYLAVVLGTALAVACLLITVVRGNR